MSNVANSTEPQTNFPEKNTNSINQGSNNTINSAPNKESFNPNKSPNTPQPVAPNSLTKTVIKENNPKTGQNPLAFLGKKDNPQGEPLNKIGLQIKSLNWFLISYIIFSIPSFIASILWIFVVFSILVIVGSLSTISSSVTSNNSASINHSNSSNQFQTNNLTFETIRRGNDKKSVLVYNLQGIIESGNNDYTKDKGIYVDSVKADFQKIKDSDQIKNVVFRLNTPGGSVYASEVLGDAIIDLMKAKKQDQVVFYFDELVASGGLWAVYKNSNNYIVASEYGETGSIGVLASFANLQGLADKIGYKQIIVKSGESKDFSNPLREPTSKELEFLQNEVEKSYDRFVNIVANGRKLAPQTVQSFANGLVYNNQQAQKYGLIDELGNLDRAISKAAENANLGQDYSVLQITRPKNFLDSLINIKTSQLDQSLGIPVNTINKVDRANLLKPGVIYAIDQYRFY